MNDSNGREIRTGDIVTVSGAYFKTSNGLFYVSNLDTERSLWLHRVKKNGEICVSSASSTQSWPLTGYCSDARKNREARLHNAEHARIEITDGVNPYHVAAEFRKKEQEARDRAENQRRMHGDSDYAREIEQTAEQCAAVAARLEAAAQPVQEKEPDIGIKFYWNGIKVDGGRLIPCYYSLDENSISISAKDYKNLPRQYFAVENNSDIYTDYFDSDRTTLTPEHPLYRFARYAALKNLMNGKTWHKPTDAQKNEWEHMRDPGQPTAADLAAVEALKTAKESARRAAEHAAELAAREERLRKISEGRHFIEQTAALHPVTDGEPTVEIGFSESPYHNSISQGLNNVFSVAAAEIILKHYDDAYPAHSGYDKTDFVVRYTDQETGEQNTYEGRYDIGDHDGGLIEHIRAFGRSTLHDEKERSEILALADWLEQFTEHGRVVNVELAPGVTDFIAYRKRKQERDRAEVQEIFDTIAMLTDAQLEAAVFCVDPNDPDKADVARLFLQELAQRDKQKAFDVFRRWKSL